MLTIQPNFSYTGISAKNHPAKQNYAKGDNVSFGISATNAKKIVSDANLGEKSKNLLLTLITENVKLEKANYSNLMKTKFNAMKEEITSKLAYAIYEKRGKFVIPKERFNLPTETLIDMEANQNLCLQNQDWHSAQSLVDQIDFRVGSSLMTHKRGAEKHFYTKPAYTKQLLQQAIARAKENEALIESSAL